jgi:hypothetical protein
LKLEDAKALGQILQLKDILPESIKQKKIMARRKPLNKLSNIKERSTTNENKKGLY